MEKYIRAGSESHKETYGKKTEEKSCFIVTESPTEWFGIADNLSNVLGRELEMLDNIEECDIGNMELVCRLFREWENRETFDKI